MLIEMRKAFSRVEVYVILLLGAVVAVVGLFDVIFANFNIRSDRYPSAYQAALVMGGSVSELFAVFLLPVFAVVPYSDSYFVEQHSGIEIASVIRAGRVKYTVCKACVVLFTAVGAIFFTYFVNQLLCLIAFPTERVLNVMRGSGDVYGNFVFIEAATNPSIVPSLNHPLLRNLLHTLYACYYGGAIALVSYAITLYYRKNRATAIVVPIAFTYLMIFGGNMLFGISAILPLGIIFGINYRIASFAPMIAAIAVLYAISIFAILYKCFRVKDVL
jgi:hypothetical protein